MSKIEKLENGWLNVPFKYLADNISKRVEPSETKLDIYIGLEHLDPQSLKIKRLGVPEDVKGVKLLAGPGDIIFGKRRAYQGKVGICDHNAIVSAHSMILRGNEKNIEKGILPFFMQGNEFYNRSIQVSEGSLSPTIKWKVLAEEKFIFPPKELQKEILEKLQTVEDAINKKEELLEKTEKYKEKLMNELLTKGIGHKEFKKTEIGEIPVDWEVKKFECIFERKQAKVKLANSEYLLDGKFPIIDQSREDIAGFTNDEGNLYDGKLPIIVFGDHTKIIKYITYQFAVGAEGVQLIVEKNKNYDIKFLFYLLCNVKLPDVGYQRYYKYFENMKFSIPGIEEQLKISKCLSEVDTLISNIHNHIVKIKKLKKKFLEDLFNPEFYGEKNDKSN